MLLANCGDTRATQATDTATDLRKERRIPATGNVQIQMLCAPFTAFSGQVLNISMNGIAISTRSAVSMAAGTEVALTATGIDSLGHVRHLAQCHDGSVVLGIEFSRVTFV